MTAELPADTSTGVSRRDLLKRGAVVGAAAAWTIPLVQVVSMTPAHADSPSAPPAGPPTNNPPPPPITTVPVKQTEPGSGNDGSSTSKSDTTVVAGNSNTAKPSLAFTGSNTMPAVGIGAAAVALGVGAIAASQVGRNKPDQAVADSSE
ncbi:MAG: twin-arginine translocation signal domain-containing protein [Jatrophihabitans sp.]